MVGVSGRRSSEEPVRAAGCGREDRKLRDALCLRAAPRVPNRRLDRAGLETALFPAPEKITAQQLREFSETYFGEHGGYAQQYLFHHARTALRKSGVAIPQERDTALRSGRN